MNSSSARAVYPVDAATQISARVMYRALVRKIRVAEGHVIATRHAINSLEQLDVMLQHLPLTSDARDFSRDCIDEAIEAMALSLPWWQS